MMALLILASEARSQESYDTLELESFVFAETIEVHKSLGWVEDSLFRAIDAECAVLKALEPTIHLFGFLIQVSVYEQLMLAITDHYTAWSLANQGNFSTTDSSSIYHFQRIVSTIKKLYYEYDRLSYLANNIENSVARTTALDIAANLQEGNIAIASSPFLDGIYGYATWELLVEAKGGDVKALLQEKWEQEFR
jgi:hypothetical protein